jgi:CHAT domain-containing protein/tetratricopeptide (TPR) repeat protein
MRPEVARRARRLVACLVAMSAAVPLLSAEAGLDLEGVRRLILDGRYDEARADARDLLSRTETAFGPDSVDAARVVDAYMDATRRGSEGGRAFPEAIRLGRRALAAKERLLGPNDPEVADTLGILGRFLTDTGHHDEAEAAFNRTVEIRERAFGPSSAPLASSLHELGRVALAKGDSARARELWLSALRMREETLGPRDREIASTMNNLAAVAARTGDYSEADERYRRAIEIWEDALGPEHPDLAVALHNYGMFKADMGDYVAARDLGTRAVAIWEKAAGPSHTAVALGLQGLAAHDVDLGDYAAARVLLERSLAIWERERRFRDDPAIPDALTTAADLLLRMGEPERAEPLLADALRLRQAAQNPWDPDLAGILDTRARALEALGFTTKARAMLERSLRIQERAYGPAHREVADALLSLAGWHLRHGQPARARELAERAADVMAKTLGPDHPRVADARAELGRIHRACRQPREAQDDYAGALAIREKAVGPRHPLVAESLVGLAEALADEGQGSQALDAALRAEAIARDHLRLVSRGLAEDEALDFSQARSSGLPVALRLAETGLTVDARTRVWDALVRSRNLVYAQAEVRHTLLRTPELQPLVLPLLEARQRLSNLLVRGPAADSPVRSRSLLDDARDQVESAERALAKAAPSLGDASGGEVGGDAVAAALPPGAALISYVRDPGPSPRYMAWVVRPAHAPVAVALGPARPIERQVERWRATIVSASETAAVETGGALRHAVWDPVAAKCPGATRVFVVPDGALHRVAWAALPSASGGYLAETGPTIHVLSAEKDLVRAREPRADGRGLLVAGGPAFDERPADSPTRIARATGAVLRGAPSTCAGLQQALFENVSGSAREAQDLAALWRQARPDDADAVVGLTGREADERAIKRLAPGRRVLHLATHGFSLSGACIAREGSALRGIGGLAPAEAPTKAARAETAPRVSGLALAGANLRNLGRAGDEDGILTAEEIASLDLSSLEWAVLSACDTGMGEVKAGEGVLGLRRAFQIAGARTVIASLWPVEDRAAQEWMQALYRERLIGARDTAEAVRRASLDVLTARRARGESTVPFFWAAFVAVGDWR